MKVGFPSAWAVASLILAASAIPAANASVVTVAFSNTEVPGISNGDTVTNQWNPYGLTISNAYWYVDGQDPFAEQMGLSLALGQGSAPVTGTISFSSLLTQLTVNFWAFANQSMTLKAFGTGNALLGTVIIGPSNVNSSSTSSFSNVQYLQWTGTGGQAQISSLSYEVPTLQEISSVPEPSTLALILASLGLLGFAARQRQRHSV